MLPFTWEQVQHNRAYSKETTMLQAVIFCASPLQSLRAERLKALHPEETYVKEFPADTPAADVVQALPEVLQQIQAQFKTRDYQLYADSTVLPFLVDLNRPPHGRVESNIHHIDWLPY